MDPMPHPGRIGRLGVVAVLALSLVGCTSSALATPGASAVATATVTPSLPVATPTPMPSPTGIASPSVGGAGIETPPDAVLSVDGGDPVAGDLGTYVWAESGSDSPWLPGAPIRAATGEVLSVTLSSDLVVSDWSAVVAPAGSPDGSGRTDVVAGPGSLDIVAPGPGSWTLAVTIRFGDLGRATWFWRLDVS